MRKGRAEERDGFLYASNVEAENEMRRGAKSH
jgi:hypothetical protein